MNSLIDFCFEGGISQYIAVTRHGARWVDGVDRCKTWFDKKSLKLAVKYLLENCYFTIGNNVFRQCIGIPMGSDPAPFFANLFLYYYENKWLNKLRKTDLQKARKFTNTFRFIDDLGSINDGGEFGRRYSEIYPPEMELGKENEGTMHASFLDLELSIVDRKFNMKLFDKRDSFPFDIVRMPYASSNMPSKIFYSSIGAEILRVARATTEKECFCSSSKKLIERMKNQGGKEHRIVKTLNKSFGKHSKEPHPCCLSAVTQCSGGTFWLKRKWLIQSLANLSYGHF